MTILGSHSLQAVVEYKGSQVGPGERGSLNVLMGMNLSVKLEPAALILRGVYVQKGPSCSLLPASLSPTDAHLPWNDCFHRTASSTKPLMPLHCFPTPLLPLPACLPQASSTTAKTPTALLVPHHCLHYIIAQPK